MTRLLNTTILVLGVAFMSPVTVAEAFPFHHKVCHTTWHNHHKHTRCHWVVFRQHPIRDTIREFLD